MQVFSDFPCGVPPSPGTEMSLFPPPLWAIYMMNLAIPGYHEC